MNTRRSSASTAMAVVLGCLVFGWHPPAVSGRTDTETSAFTRSERPTVEVMFVLDTTSSMTGLIAAAKDKIWSIANTLASADPPPQIRMGLMAYRDRGDAYVTVFTPLSSDLDAVYAQLMQFDAVGGGDTPESVNQALFEAVTKPAWTPGSSVYRVIFLVGDAPPHMNYPDDVTYSRSCALAAQQEITINTIQCGSMMATGPIWQAIAAQGKGAYFQVAQSGNAVLYDTPFDEPISRLSRALDATRIYYGDADHRDAMEARQQTADDIYRRAKPSAVAKRTIFNSQAAGASNFIGAQELVSAVESGELDAASVPPSELPAELRDLTPAGLAAHIDRRSQERKALQARIDALAQRRQQFIQEKLDNEKEGGADSLDAKIYTCIQTQAAARGIAYTRGPVY